MRIEFSVLDSTKFVRRGRSIFIYYISTINEGSVIETKRYENQTVDMHKNKWCEIMKNIFQFELWIFLLNIKPINKFIKKKKELHIYIREMDYLEKFRFTVK